MAPAAPEGLTAHPVTPGGQIEAPPGTGGSAAPRTGVLKTGGPRTAGGEFYLLFGYIVMVDKFLKKL